MPETLESVLDQLSRTHNDFTEFRDRYDQAMKEHGTASEETRAAQDAANEAITKLKQDYEELRLAANRPAANGGDGPPDPEKELRQKAFVKFLRYGSGEQGRSMMSPEEIRALSSASDADGGFLIPDDYESQIIMEAYNQAEIRSVANVGTTGRDTVMMPALAKPTVAWGRVNVAVDPQDLGTGSERITIYDLKALTLIHNNTLDDSEADVWGEISQAFSMAIAESEDDAFATGAGDDSPQGVIADSRVQARYTPSGVAAALFDASNNGIDMLINGLHSLKKTYRRNSTWGMNSTTEGLVRTLKNDNGDYLWQPPVQAGNPATLLGRPLINPEGMPDIAANAFPIVVGDWRSGYRIRDRSGLSVQRLVERYAEYDQTGMLIKKRTGGQVVLDEAFHCFKIATS